MAERMVDRLYEYADYKRVSLGKLEKLLEIGNGYLSKQKKKSIGGGIGEVILNKIIERIPEINIIWLITGQGEMIKSQDESLIEKIDPDEVGFSTVNRMIGVRNEKLSQVTKEKTALETQVRTLKRNKCKCECEGRYGCAKAKQKIKNINN